MRRSPPANTGIGMTVARGAAAAKGTHVTLLSAHSTPDPLSDPVETPPLPPTPDMPTGVPPPVGDPESLTPPSPVREPPATPPPAVAGR